MCSQTYQPFFTCSYSIEYIQLHIFCRNTILLSNHFQCGFKNSFESMYNITMEQCFAWVHFECNPIWHDMPIVTHIKRLTWMGFLFYHSNKYVLLKESWYVNETKLTFPVLLYYKWDLARLLATIDTIGMQSYLDEYLLQYRDIFKSKWQHKEC